MISVIEPFNHSISLILSAIQARDCVIGKRQQLGYRETGGMGGGVQCVGRLCRVVRVNPTLPTALVYHDLSLVNVGLHSFLQVLISVLTYLL